MFASFASMVATSFYAIAGVAPRHTILLVSNGRRHSSGQELNGIAVGIYVALVKERPTICVIPARFLSARIVQKVLTMCV